MLTTSRNPSLKWIKIAIPKLHLFSNVISLGIELVTFRTESRDIGHSVIPNVEPQILLILFLEGVCIENDLHCCSQENRGGD